MPYIIGALIIAFAIWLLRSKCSPRIAHQSASEPQPESGGIRVEFSDDRPTDEASPPDHNDGLDHLFVPGSPSNPRGLRPPAKKTKKPLGPKPRERAHAGDFIAVDVETANANFASICQIGIAHFKNGELVAAWSTLVDPQDDFDPFNTSIHGITADMVAGAPTFADLDGKLHGFFSDQIAVCHTHFDRSALSQACRAHGINPIQCLWLDTAKVVRRTWTQFAERGYGLSNVCEFIGYEFSHHDALEDAKASGYVLLTAIQESGIDLAGWLERIEQPVFSAHIKQDGDPIGPLAGEVLVFTGALSMTRAEAAALAARIGCTVNEGVTKRTTILVLGSQDYSRLAGYEKSLKHRKAEDLITKGQPIRILTEQNFAEMVAAAKAASA
jgi:DNA polymerase-3 subunit epsilon